MARSIQYPNKQKKKKSKKAVTIEYRQKTNARTIFQLYTWQGSKFSIHIQRNHSLVLLYRKKKDEL